MVNKLTSIFSSLFPSNENELSNMSFAVDDEKHDSIIYKLRIINKSIEVSRELIAEEMDHYSEEQRKGLREHIQKDVAKTKDHIMTMMQSLLQYIDILKKRLYQHHLFKNEAYYYANELYNMAFQACLWIPKSDALILLSQKQFAQRSDILKMLLEEIKSVINVHQKQPRLIIPNKNYEWLLKRQREIEKNITKECNQTSEKDDRSQLKVIKERLFEVEPVSNKMQEIDLALLEAIYRNGRRFYETLCVQNTLNILRAELKNNFE